MGKEIRKYLVLRLKYIPYYPDSPVEAGGCACTGIFLDATLLVWAG